MSTAMSIKAICVLVSEKGVTGTLGFSQEKENTPTKIEGSVTGLTPGDHGFHIHQYGDTTNGCVSAGSHFNPRDQVHGGPNAEQRHAGDLGNIAADETGTARVFIQDQQIPLIGRNSIIGRSLVMHEKADDLGKGGNEESLKTGNAGSRVACGIIGITK